MRTVFPSALSFGSHDMPQAVISAEENSENLIGSKHSAV